MLRISDKLLTHKTKIRDVNEANDSANL